MSEQKQATPTEELRRRFMDHSIPLNEAGHWARRRIEQLEAEIERLRGAFINLRTEIAQIKNSGSADHIVADYINTVIDYALAATEQKP